MKPAVSFIATVCIASVCIAQPAPDSIAHEISLPDTKGKPVRLTSLKGKVVLIDFWASWCVPCIKEIPQLNALYKKYKNKGFEIYGISLDTDKSNWKKAVLKDNIKCLQVIDTEGEVANEWNINYIPNTFLLDKNGKIVAADPEDDALEDLLKKLLG